MGVPRKDEGKEMREPSEILARMKSLSTVFCGATFFVVISPDPRRTITVITMVFLAATAVMSFVEWRDAES